MWATDVNIALTLAHNIVMSSHSFICLITLTVKLRANVYTEMRCKQNKIE